NQPFSWIPDLVARYLFTGDQLALLAAAREGHDEHPALADLYGTTWNPVLLDQMRRNNWNQPPEEHLRERLLRSVPFLEGGELRRLVDELERLAQRQLAYEAYPEKRGLQGSATSGMIEALTFLHGTTGKEIYRDLAETLYDILVEEKTIPVNVRSLLAYAARRQVPPPGPDTVAPPQADAAFLISCQNDDGGFGLAPGFPSDLDSTYRAVDSLRLLGVPVPQARRCAAWIAACRLPVGGYANRPGGQDPEVAWTCFALHSLALLGVPPPELERTVAWLKDGFQTDERWNCSDDSSSSTVAHAVLTLALLGETAPDPFAVRSFLLSRQIDRGGFADESRAQTATTALVLNALRQQGGMDQTKGLLAWLASLRRHDGGYGWPDADHSSLANTTHVLSCLSALSASLTEQELSRTRRFVRHCRSATGGFANRPGRTPTVLHTWYGVRAAAYLGPEPTP
ncbi:MAG: prenyltransferase/squalene oxidase repeat-containing protein, partial [Lentisphaeria bacterium]|nr:prenyltransferase/squalene oxidase repeat-containing protein [Lentisphaeria bacterium]